MALFGAFLRGSFGLPKADRPAIERVKQLARAALQASEETAFAVNEIVITARNDAFGPNGAPTRFIILSSSDGVSWQFEWRVLSSTGWTAGLSRTFTRPS